MHAKNVHSVVKHNLQELALFFPHLDFEDQAQLVKFNSTLPSLLRYLTNFFCYIVLK